MRYIIILLLAGFSCKKPSINCGEVAQILDGGVMVRVDSTNLIYYHTSKPYQLGDKICQSNFTTP